MRSAISIDSGAVLGRLNNPHNKKASQFAPTGLIANNLIVSCVNFYYSLEAFSDRYLATPSGDAPIPALPFSH